MFPENIIPGTLGVSISKDGYVGRVNHSVSAFGSSTGTFNGMSMSTMVSVFLVL